MEGAQAYVDLPFCPWTVLRLSLGGSAPPWASHLRPPDLHARVWAPVPRAAPRREGGPRGAAQGAPQPRPHRERLPARHPPPTTSTPRIKEWGHEDPPDRYGTDVDGLRASGKQIITAWGMWGWNRDAWRLLPGPGAGVPPGRANPYDEVDLPIDKYASLWREAKRARAPMTSARPRYIRLWQRAVRPTRSASRARRSRWAGMRRGTAPSRRRTATSSTSTTPTTASADQVSFFFPPPRPSFFASAKPVSEPQRDGDGASDVEPAQQAPRLEHSHVAVPNPSLDPTDGLLFVERDSGSRSLWPRW